MCTAAIYKTKDFYFGRNLDYEVSYGESVAVTPRKYKFVFTEAGECAEHYAMIGMAHVSGGYPLYYDAEREGTVHGGAELCEKRGVSQFCRWKNRRRAVRVHPVHPRTVR